MRALQVDIYTASGAPAVSTPVLRSLAGKPGAAKKALLELEGQDTSESPADDFDGDFPIACGCFARKTLRCLGICLWSEASASSEGENADVHPAMLWCRCSTAQLDLHV